MIEPYLFYITSLLLADRAIRPNASEATRFAVVAIFSLAVYLIPPTQGMDATLACYMLTTSIMIAATLIHKTASLVNEMYSEKKPLKLEREIS